jgi:hypothetical protein
MRRISQQVLDTLAKIADATRRLPFRGYAAIHRGFETALRTQR